MPDTVLVIKTELAPRVIVAPARQGPPGIKGDTGDPGIEAADPPLLYDAVARTLSLPVGNVAGSVAAGDDPRFDALAGAIADLDATIDQANVVLINVAQTITAPKVIQAQAPTETPLVIQTAASQTADATQWKDSTGAVKARIDSGGLLTTTAYVGDNNLDSYVFKRTASPNARLRAAAVGHVPLVVQAFTGGGQTSDLQQWQSGSGTAFAYVTAGGSFHADGDLSVGTTPLSSGVLTVSTRTASNVGAVVRGVASQTGVLHLWQDSAGSQLARIDTDGSVIIGGTSWQVAQGVNARRAFLQPANAAHQPLLVRGAASQTADLELWQDSAGSTVSSMTAAGGLISGVTDGYRLDPANRRGRIGADVLGGAYGFLINHQVNARPNLVLYAGTTQTADALDVYDTAGALSLQVLPSGTVFTPGRIAVAGDLSAQLSATSTSTTRVGSITRAAASQTADQAQWQDSTGAVKVAVDSIGRIISATAANFGGFPAGVAYLGVASASATNQVSVMRGAASQTANLLEWQSSAGAALARVDSGGNITLTNGNLEMVKATSTDALLRMQNSAQRWDVFLNSADAQSWQLRDLTNGVTVMRVAPNGGTRFLVADAAAIPLLARGAASQTGSLQQWQNSAGSPAALVDAGGGASFGTAGGSRFTVNGVNFTTTAVSITSASTGWVGAAIRGLASQTADLQQWQDSTGANVASVTSSGAGVFGAGGQIAGVRLSVNTASATATGLAIKGFASQSNDLTQWQSNTGTVLALLTASGDFRGNSVHAAGSQLPAKLSAQPGVATSIGAIIRGAASQTANLLEAQDSGGVLLAAITATGLPRWVAANVQTTVGAAGGANALPATPTKYLKVVDDAGTTLVVPAYAAA